MTEVNPCPSRYPTYIPPVADGEPGRCSDGNTSIKIFPSTQSLVVDTLLAPPEEPPVETSAAPPAEATQAEDAPAPRRVFDEDRAPAVPGIVFSSNTGASKSNPFRGDKPAILGASQNAHTRPAKGAEIPQAEDYCPETIQANHNMVVSNPACKK